MTFYEKIPVVFGAIIAILCQLLLADNVHIFYAVPNFILAYVIAIAVANNRSMNYITAFFMGLIYDLTTIDTVGVMAFVCVAILFIASTVFHAIDNETPFMPIVVIIFTSFLGELMYSLLMIACGNDASLLEALIYDVLPCGLYDIVVALITFVIVSRFVFKQRNPSEMSIIDPTVE